MHILSINVITFTAQIYNALHMQSKKGDIWHLGAHGPFGPRNPPMLSRLLDGGTYPQCTGL